MYKNTMTVYDIMLQMISDNQLSLEEETALKKFLDERQTERDEEKRNRCLSGIIEKELAELVQAGKLSQATQQRYHPILRRCFIDTSYGNLDASLLSEAVIQEFVMEAQESYNLNRNDLLFFTGMLKLGLNKMAQLGLISFTPHKRMFKSFIEPVQGIRQIINPYSEQDTDRIMEWIEDHSSDTRALAVGLWLSGGLSPLQIINLKKDGCWGNTNTADKTVELDRNIFNMWQRANYIRKAIGLHPEEDKFVFMVNKDGVWKKLTKRSLPIKLYYICQDIGIKYKAFHLNEMIVEDE